MRRSLLLAAALLASAPGAARGDGLPVGNVDVGEAGVVAPGSTDRIVALRAGRRATLVARIARGEGNVLRSRRIGEALTIPGVALDGTAGGRSADGKTVVLIRPRRFGQFPLRHTRLVALDARSLRVERRITLRGDFSFDALSPDGRALFVTHYVDARDPRKYLVQSFDLRSGRLDPDPIVDAREPDEDMRGYPQTRVSTADGRWAYTLYDGGGEPFVHALDTERRRAFCIDLPMLARSDEVYDMRLRLGPGHLDVTLDHEPAALVDTRTMRASAPVPPRPRATHPAPDDDDSSGFDLWLVAALAAFGFVLVAGARRARRGASARPVR